MAKRKICMIVHQYPPDAGATAYRMDFRAKFLQSQGFDVDIFAPGYKNETQIESSGIRLHRVAAVASSGSTDMDYTRLNKAGRMRLPVFLHPLAGFLRWLPPLVSHLRRFEADDTILYTYNNPVSLHLAALAVRKRFKAWVCEFRDPIAGYEYSHRGFLGHISDAWLEKQVLRHASIICMREGIQAGPDDYCSAKGEVVLLPDYGVDLDLFTGFEQLSSNFGQPLGIYAGTVFNDISFEPLSSALDLYQRSNGKAVIRLFGPEHREHLTYDNLNYCGNISFKALLDEYRKAHFLIIYDESESESSRTAGFFPSKLAELMAARRPVLFIGNSGSQTAKIIADRSLGVCTTNDATAISESIDKIMTGLNEHQFDLSMNDDKRKLIDASVPESAFVKMLSDITG